MRSLFALLLQLALSGCVITSGMPVKLRTNTSHGLGNARGAVADAGLSASHEVIVTPSSTEDGKPYLAPDLLFADAEANGATILSSSFSGWDYMMDSAGYLKLTGKGMVHVYAYVPRRNQPDNAPPPAAFVTVNKVGGATGGGIEFGMSPTYMHGKGQSDSPSGVTAQLAGLMGSLKYQHSEWNWFDVKAALRSTSSNFSTGYDPKKYGYGTIDYPAANRLGDAAAFPLFSPAAVTASQKDEQLIFFVNSFKQSRRAVDALFKFVTPPPVVIKELSYPEITAFGGEALFTGDFSTAGNIFKYKAAKEETAYFVWFTKDRNGYFSRIEPYSIIGPVMFHKSYGPRLDRNFTNPMQ